MPPKTSKYKEDLIPRIRDLIDGYSSASILKEYLQNADDSGATELIVTFDKQSYQKLKGTKYELAMGKSLLLANNSIFKEKDFNSIVQISAQGKSLDASSTGRFGQGFSSSFSISDHPTFLSNNKIYWFDILKTAVSQDEYDDILHWEDNDFNEITHWLNTFKIAGFDGSKPYQGTIFRLPLRQDNNDSKISNEVFKFEDFLTWCDEWKDKAENLLFLRNIHTLILQEIDENGNKIVHLEIKTNNSEEIQNINDSIQSEFGNDELINICNRWKNKNDDLTLFKYHHNFLISYWNREEKQKENRDETWAVVNGLFKGEDNCLIDKAIDVLKITPNPRKVLPWAGVALCLDENKKPIKKDSQWYTFLPLPIESSYPIQLHGWFDLNPKRTEITHDGTGDDKETLVSWNQQLLEHGVGVAWALLIDYIKDEKYLDNYYSFWAKKKSNELDKYLIKGFYKKIIDLKCFHTMYKNEKKWMYPTDNIYFFEDREDTLLSNAFKEHFQIISPKPPKVIIENFETIENINLNEITPLFIRNYLEKVSKEILGFPISLTDIPILMLSTKSWFLEVVKYCADKGVNYNLIRNLPLELTLDGKIYKVGVNTLVDENPNLKLFQDREYLFLDKELTNIVKNSTTLPSSWLQATLKNKIVILLEYWEKLDLNREWIKELIEIIDSDRDELNEAVSDIKRLPIVYQQNKEYVCLDSDISNYPPIMIREEDKNNIKYFEAIGMNTIHIDYIEIYKPLLKWTDKYTGNQTFITKLSSEILAKHLLLLDNFDFFKDRDTREFLMDLLAEDTSWFDNLYDNNDKNKILSMPFIQTVGGNLYSVSSDKKLFLPTGFNSSLNIKGLEGEYELVATTTDSKLFKMYKKMGIEEQTAENYIKEIIIPFLENSDSIEDKREVLKWLAMELENITKGSDNEIMNILKKSNIIPIQLNEHRLTTALNLYHPTINLPVILKNKEFMPIIFEDDTIQEEWIYFLERIGISKSILPSHIMSVVKKIVEDNNQENAILLLNYIANNFEIFEEMNILDTLKEYAWFPIEQPNDILKPKSEYTALKKPNELILSTDIKIAGGYYHVLNKKVNLGKKDEKVEIKAYDMAQKLGIITNIPDESVFESFRVLMNLSPTNGKVVDYVKEFYKYIGRRFYGKRIDFDIEERTILINNQWISPKYVYQLEKPLTSIYSWNTLVGNETESNLAKGLISLGIQEKPTLDFFIEQLQNLPQEKKLNSYQLNDAKVLLEEIQNEDENFLTYDKLPILTGNNQLVLSSNLYINDFPAYKKAEDKNKNLKFCQVQFEQLAKRLNVLSLNENYTSKILNFQESEINHSIINILEKDSFKEGILRLLYHEKKIKKDEINESILNEVLPSKLIFVSQLVIKYSIENKFLFRSDETTYEEDGELYILEQDDEEDMIEIISKYICDTKDLKTDSFGWIQRILREKMSREEIHNLLDRKKVIELPQQFDIEDEVGIFDNSHSIESDKKVTYDNSTNQEKNSEFKGEIAPPTKPKQSSENINNGNTSNSSNNIVGNKSSSNSSSNKSNKKIVSSNDRKPVYVGKDKEIDEEKQRSQRESAKEIGDKGENYILANKEALLLSKTNYFQKAPTNNRGFDIYEKDASGQTIIRYIEVKTLTGQWGQGGVGITEHQLDFAQKQKDKWWLFVVENINTNNTKIYQFENPVLEANKFMFDSSWKQLAYLSNRN